jgi:hypothetical protein
MYQPLFYFNIKCGRHDFEKKRATFLAVAPGEKCFAPGALEPGDGVFCASNMMFFMSHIELSRVEEEVTRSFPGSSLMLINFFVGPWVHLHLKMTCSLGSIMITGFYVIFI